MNKQFIAIILVVVVGLFGVLMFTRDDKKNEGSGAETTAQATNHTLGQGTKNITLIEYGDFQCPACKAFYPIVKQIKADYGDEIKFQFRHYPLVQIHPNAFMSSRAAEAAGLQGKFFEMHDLLYENQEAWANTTDPTDTFVSFAGQIGLNADKFRSDLTSKAVADSINADTKAAQDAGANSTPTFVLNGKKIDQNPQNLEDFKKLIDEEIARSSNL